MQKYRYLSLFRFLICFIKNSYSISGIPVQYDEYQFSETPASNYLKKLNGVSGRRKSTLITIHV